MPSMKRKGSGRSGARRSLVAVGLAVALLGGACTSDGDASSTSTLLPVFPPTVNGPPMTLGALLEEAVSIDLDRQCIVVLAQGGGFEAVVIWPPGTAVDVSDSERPALVMPDGTRYEESDSVALGGGMMKWDAVATRGPYDHLSRADVCGAESVFMASGEHFKR